jgi:hypothetical protein
MSKRKKVHDIDADTPLIPEIIADAITSVRAKSDKLCARARYEWSTSLGFRESFEGKDERAVLQDWFNRWLTEEPGKVITVVVSAEGNPWPLIYDLEMGHSLAVGDGIDVVSEAYHDEILSRVAEDRWEDIGTEVEFIKDRLTLLFAFAGPSEVVMDWR